MNRRIVLVCQRSPLPFIFEAAVQNNIDLIALREPGEFSPAEMPGVIDVVDAPVLSDPERALEVLGDLMGREGFDGIVTLREEAIPWTARAASRLSLPGLSYSAAIKARDKAAMRLAFKESNLNTPFFRRIEIAEELQDIPDLPWPLVAKPTSALNSAGVCRCNDMSELKDAMSFIRTLNAEKIDRVSADGGKLFSGALVEQFIGGAEFVVECFAHNGRVVALAVGDKGNPTGPCFEETYYTSPPLIDPAMATQICDQARRGMLALGITDGPGHCEIRVDSRGEPYILEIGARIGGSGVSHHIVQTATGLDMCGMLFDLATGGRPIDALPDYPTYTGGASNYIIPLGGSGVLTEVSGLDRLGDHPEFAGLLRFMDDGTRVAPFPRFDGFIGFILGRHADGHEALAFKNWLDDTIVPRWA